MGNPKLRQKKPDFNNFGRGNVSITQTLITLGYAREFSRRGSGRFLWPANHHDDWLRFGCGFAQKYRLLGIFAGRGVYEHGWIISAAQCGFCGGGSSFDLCRFC